MPQLDPTTFVSQVFWLVVCFIFIIIYSAKVTLPQLSKVFQHRYDKIEGTRAMGSSLQKQIEQLNDERQQQLTEARHYAHDRVTQATSDLNKQVNQTKLVYRSEVKQQLRTYESQLANIESSTLNDLNMVSVDISQIIMDKISPLFRPRADKKNSANKDSIVHDR